METVVFRKFAIYNLTGAESLDNYENQIGFTNNHTSNRSHKETFQISQTCDL